MGQLLCYARNTTSQYNKGAEDLTQRIQIEEIVGESNQGRSGGVFRCIGDDEESYFLKGLGVGRPDLAKEWICANLARAFGLPVAGFALAELYHYVREFLTGLAKAYWSWYLLCLP